jgi:hypothetical protein
MWGINGCISTQRVEVFCAGISSIAWYRRQTTTPQRYCGFTEICGDTSKVAVNRNIVERENVPRLLQKLSEGGAISGFELH